MPETDSQTSPVVKSRAERYAQAAALLRRWLAEAEHEDERDYDWEAIDRELQDSRACFRETDNEERGSQ